MHESISKIYKNTKKYPPKEKHQNTYESYVEITPDQPLNSNGREAQGLGNPFVKNQKHHIQFTYTLPLSNL